MAPLLLVQAPKHTPQSQKPLKISSSALQELQILKSGPWRAPPLYRLEPNPSSSWKYDPGGDRAWFKAIQVLQGALLKETIVNYLQLVLLVGRGHGILSSTRTQLVANHCYIASEIYSQCLNFNNLNNRPNQVEPGRGRLLMKSSTSLMSEGIFALTLAETQRWNIFWRTSSQTHESFLGLQKQLQGQE